MISLLVAAIFVSVLLYRSFGQRRGALVVAGLLGVVVASALLLSNDKMLSRVAETQDAFSAHYRTRHSAHVLAEADLGFGLGTFSDAYPKFQSFFSTLLVNHAHNDYLETLAETGVIGFALVLWMLVSVFRSGSRKISEKSDDDGRLLTLACLSGIAAILVHSCFDFTSIFPRTPLCSLFYVPP